MSELTDKDPNSYLSDTASLFTQVLVVEDEPAHAALLRRSLEGLVGEVHLASNGSEALRVVESTLIELILCDLNLPDINGLELLQQIRIARPGVPVIVMTSSSNLNDAVSAMRAGAWDYMVKEFSKDTRNQLELVLARTAERQSQILRELQVRAERDAFWSAVRTARDGMAILGRSGLVVFSNESFTDFCQLCGRSQLPGRTINIVDVISEQDESVAESLKASLKGSAENSIWSSEVQIEDTSPDGKSRKRAFELLVTTLALSESSSVVQALPLSAEFKRSVIWIRDITEQREQERYQRDLLSTTSHDLKGPLGAILTSAEMLDENENITDDLAKQLITRTASCARNAITIIDELLSARKIQDGVLHIHPRMHPLYDIIDDTILDFASSAKAKKIELFHDVEDKDIAIYADRIALIRVLGNLVSNAIKYTEDGGTVLLKARHAGKGVVISITDSGSGISGADRRKLFQRYGRLEKHKEIEGTGLGLFVAKNIVDAHNGRIEVKSKLGAGTTFVLTFPGEKSKPHKH